MESVVLVIHLILALAIIAVVLIQPSEGGGLGGFFEHVLQHLDTLAGRMFG